MEKMQGFLIDLDGTTYNDSIPIPGALEAIHWLRGNGIPFRFITNTTMKSRETLQDKLQGIGITAHKEEIFSAAYAGSLYVRRKANSTCFLLLLDDAKKEYIGLEGREDKVDYVVVGDLGKHANFENLNTGFRYLLNGAELVALQKNRYWLSDNGYEMDAGAFVAMLEYAANTKATLIGKPARPFFEMALKDLNCSAENVMMIGDDIESDIAGAKRLGMKTALVRTGKFRRQDLERSEVKPDYILSSIHDLISN